ncbi:hypothetical protein BGZ76_011776 [Entomortierella beljakovae]|nr:hypothetical protein BGZ76_011776 [Entomortierella beljakovae]
MKFNSTPTPSRTSISSNLSRSTALDAPHLNSDLHHTNHNNNQSSNDTNNETTKESLYAIGDNTSGPIQMFPLKSDEGYSDEDAKKDHEIDPSLLPDEGYSDNDLKKGHEIIQLPDEAALQDMDLGWTCTWNDLPQWMKDNPAIITGYRRATYSYSKCVKTLWFLHNETVNIWSHLLGAIAFIIIAPVTYYKVLDVHALIKWSDIGVMYAFIAGAISLQIIYISTITVLGCATIIAVMRPKFQIPQFRWVRSVLFAALGLSGLAPIVHGIVIYGFTLAQKSAGLNYLFCMGAAYIIGVLLYATRTPECFFPGKFDNIGASHQIFHICVLIGCTVHFAGVIKAMGFWHDNNPQCTIPIDQMKIMFG